MEKEKKPIVSIIIPTYNRANTIIRSINSVLFQDFQNFEIIIVDDCSTDNTQELIKNNYSKDNRIIYTRLSKNSGACVARNKGIELAQGQYIAFQDSDDEWLCNKLSKQIIYLQNHDDYQAIFCQFIKKVSNKVEILPKTLSTPMSTEILKGNFISTQTLLIKKEAIVNIKGFDNHLPRYQDWELAIRILEKYNVYYLQEPLVIMHIQDNSISRNRLAHFISIESILKKHFEKFNNKPDILCSIYKKLGFAYFLLKKEPHSYVKKHLNYFIKALSLNPLNYKLLIVIVFFLFPISKQTKCEIFEKITKPTLL